MSRHNSERLWQPVAKASNFIKSGFFGVGNILILRRVLQAVALFAFMFFTAETSRAETALNDFDHPSKEEYQALREDNARRAEQGDPQAQDTLARQEYFSPRAEGDMAKAYYWFRKAADHGNGDAQESIGEMYEHGWHVKQDYAEAIRWYRRAASYGDFRAMFRLSYLHQRGLGVPQDYQEAYYWLVLEDKLMHDNSDAVRSLGRYLTAVQKLEVEKRVSEYHLQYAVPQYGIHTPESPPPQEFCDKNFRDIATIYWRAQNTLPAEIKTPPWKDVEANIDNVLKSFVTENTKTVSFAGVRIIKANKSPEEILASDPNAIYIDMEFKTVGAFSSWDTVDNRPLRDLSVTAHIVRNYDHDNLFRAKMHANAKQPTPNGPKLDRFYQYPKEALMKIGCLILANSANKMCTAIRDLDKNTVAPMPVSCP